MALRKKTFSKKRAEKFYVSEEYLCYKFHCYAVGCDSFLELDVLVEEHADDYDIDLNDNRDCVVSAFGVYEGGDLNGCICKSKTDALNIALTHGWEEGDTGVQRGHIYCPKHKKAAQ